MNHECEIKQFMLFSDAVINISTLCFWFLKQVVYSVKTALSLITALHDMTEVWLKSTSFCEIVQPSALLSTGRKKIQFLSTWKYHTTQ